ncbi:hypothetical protein KHA80_09190 [Anaerobacillus sp. HL2]|nr:hypothetical protein KHA80_09190 [Anaerobacillus sp. HL2]
MSWVNLGKDIVISLEDILNVVQFLNIKKIDKDNIYFVPVELCGKSLEKGSFEKYKDRGIIKDDSKN